MGRVVPQIDKKVSPKAKRLATTQVASLFYINMLGSSGAEGSRTLDLCIAKEFSIPQKNPFFSAFKHILPSVVGVASHCTFSQGMSGITRVSYAAKRYVPFWH